MIKIRRADSRGTANLGWLHSRHTFSFGHYYDPAYMGFGPLRVINEDRVHPGAGFDTHGHHDMEILSYVLEGELEHRDSTGSGSVIRPGDVQRMSAGRGILHSEYNHSREEPVHFLQIWIEPGQQGLEPGYEQKHFGDEACRNSLCLAASGDGHDGSVLIHQDAALYLSRLDSGRELQYRLEPGRGAWLQVARGGLRLNGEAMESGDGGSMQGPAGLSLTAGKDGAELLLFDLAL